MQGTNDNKNECTNMRQFKNPVHIDALKQKKYSQMAMVQKLISNINVVQESITNIWVKTSMCYIKNM